MFVESKPRLVLLILLLVLTIQHSQASAQQTDAGVEVKSAILKLVADINVPAREAGVLDVVDVAEGDSVIAGQLLAQIDDVQPKLLKRRAELELEIARSTAASDIEVRQAEEELAVATVDFQRAEQSRRQFARALSDSEFDQLRLDVTRGKLKLEQSKLDRDNAVQRQQLSQNELLLAQAAVLRRTIASPLKGIVVEIYRKKGEWVKPGDEVMRIIELDRLRVEGFVDAHQTRTDLLGKRVKVTAMLPSGRNVEVFGEIHFVSPEIDPVNQQVRVWAIIENVDRILRPGMRARMLIQTNLESVSSAAKR